MQNVAIACLPSGATGNTSAAIAASPIRSNFPSIIFDLMVVVGSEAKTVQERHFLRTGLPKSTA